jgi:Fe-S-cluster containining protein
MLNDLLNSDMNFKNNTCNHKCSGCGECCTAFIPITKKELMIIKKYVKDNNIEGNYLSTESGQNLYAFCPFLNKENHKCNIYEVRPYVCRKFKCDKNKETLIKEREEYSRRADYNGFFNNTPTASIQYLVYGDYMYDITYRRLNFKIVLESDPLLKIKFGELTIEKEQAIMPLLADKELIKKGGGE